MDELQIALALDDNDSDVHRILAAVNLTRDDHDKAAYHQERALASIPNNDLIVVQQGELLTWLGRPEEGIEWIRKAMRLNPYHPERFWNHLGRACYSRRAATPRRSRPSRASREPDHTHHAFLAAALAQMGNAVAAAAHAAEVVKPSRHSRWPAISRPSTTSTRPTARATRPACSRRAYRREVCRDHVAVAEFSALAR